MSQLKLSIHTQTPCVRFLKDSTLASRSLADYREDEDYQLSPGGVTRMLSGLSRRLVERRRVRRVTWHALARAGPASLDLAPGVALEHVRIADRELGEYARAKSALWNAIHGLDGERESTSGVSLGLAHLARAHARRARTLHARDAFDAFYVHDFQLLALADALPRGPARVFRWHVPVPADGFPHAEWVVDRLNAHAAVIVSTRAYASRLRRLGVHVPIYARYPYVDPAERRRVVTEDDARAFDERWGLDERDAVFLAVARMDPMKSQDVAIRALARIARDAPHAKLLLVGGGGFSGGRRASLGIPAAERWRESLVALARDLGVADRVIFTGNLPESDLDVAYTRSRAVLLPSSLEGFGLAAVEGWLYGRPAIVSRGAGVAELVRDGRNGYSFDPGDDAALADAMSRLATDAELGQRLGESGRLAARACHLENGLEGVWSVLGPHLASPASDEEP